MRIIDTVKTNISNIDFQKAINDLDKSKENDKSLNDTNSSTYKKWTNPVEQSKVMKISDSGSKYDKGYIQDLNLKDYRAANREQELNGQLTVIGEIVIILLAIISAVFLLHVIIRKWSLIKKIFTG